MKLFMNMKIAAKLLTGFIIVAIIAAVVGAVGIVNLKNIDKSDTQLYENMTVPISQLADINKDFQMIRVQIRDTIIETDLEKMQAIHNSIRTKQADIERTSTEFDKTTISDKMKAAFKDYTTKKNEYNVQLDNVLNLALANKKVEALALMGETASAGKASKVFQESIDAIITMKVADAKAKSDNNSANANNATNTMLIVIIIGVIIAISLGIFLSKIISKPMKVLADAADKLALGDIDVKIEVKTKDEIGKLTEAFSKMVDNIKVQSDVAEKIAAGDLSIKIIEKSDKDVLSKSLKLVVETLQKLVAESEILTKSTVEGKLDTRGNGDAFKGGYKEIVLGINKLIDAFVGPINVTADYIDRISKGDIPPKITDIYNGDFNVMKNNLNLCIDSINLLVTDAGSLVEAAVAGKLSTRADASKHRGDYKKIVQGVNDTLDAVIEPVKEAATVLQEMSSGNLKVRVKGEYKGDHADIKNALNDTLDSLSAYVTEISEVLDEMSNSNLELTINNEYKGDFAQIKDALNLIIQSFNEVFTEINNAADQVSAGSNQVSDGSQALSQGTTEQASSIEELTSSITEVAAQTKQNAVNASQANELSLDAKEGATLGNSHMKEMLKSMEEINESSSNISKIIKVIDDIAFQTNMLALNAAVEAARAGQHGKGFAVVAEEVRNLAARSAKAAKETADLVEGSIKKVELGTKIANNTAESLDQIVLGVSKAATLVGEIAAASNEQATAIFQINKGIEQVSDVVQTNSATAEQSAAASEELSSQAAMLKNMVGKFKLKRGSASAYNETTLETKRDLKHTKNNSLAHGEAAATRNRPKISLSKTDFGKY